MGIAKTKLLVVEDHSFQRKALICMLKRLDISDVHEACDGEKAIDLVQQRKFDLIICDLRMPNMDGLAMLRNFAEINFKGCIIISSALAPDLLASVEKMGKALGLSILGSIGKPPKLDSLAQFINQARSPMTASPQVANPLDIQLADIHAGLKRGEFMPYFQAQTCFKTQDVLSAEVLVRWQHPKYGLLSPFHFLPLIESHRLMDVLTEQMIFASARQLAKWHEAGTDIKLSINLSASSFGSDKLTQALLLACERFGVKPERITLEVTESALAKNIAQAMEQLNRFRMHGFALAIDDFGTGYSSFTQLNNYPFTELKIDRSFIAKMEQDPSAMAIVESSLSLAKKLNLKTVAEGIETPKQWSLLKKLECDLCQGYLIHKPSDAAHFGFWLKQQNVV